MNSICFFLFFLILGTTHYMAPEVMRGKGYGLEVDAPSSEFMIHEQFYSHSKSPYNRAKRSAAPDSIRNPRFGHLEYFFLRTACMFIMVCSLGCREFHSFFKLFDCKKFCFSFVCRLLCGQLPFGENADNDREASNIAFFVRLQSSYVAARSAELCWQGSRTFPKHWTNALRKSLWS